MKRYLTTIIALVVLIAVAAGVAIVLGITNKNSDEPSETESPSEGTYVDLIPFAYDNVNFVETFSNDRKITLEQKLVETAEGSGVYNKVWECTSDASIVANTSSVNSLVSGILSSSSGTIIENVSDITEYGFDETGKSVLYIKVADNGGNAVTLYIGSYDFSRSYRYVYLDDGSKNVYKVNAYSTARMLFQKESVIQMKAFTYLTTDELYMFTVYEQGEKSMELECTGYDEEADAALWKVKYPLERKSQDSAVNNLVSQLKDLGLSSIYASEVTEEDFVNYGLAPAMIEYYVYVRNSEGELVRYFIKIGNKTEEGDAYFCIIDDGEDGKYDIFTVSTSSVYRSVNPLDYIVAWLYMEDSDLISKIQIDISGEQHTMVYTYETVKTVDKTTGEEVEKEEVTRFFDGKEAIDNDDYCVVASYNKYTVPTEEDIALNRDGDITNDIKIVNPYEAFNWVLLSLYTNLVIKDIQIEEPTPEEIGEKLVSVTFTERDGDVYNVELFRRDNTTAWAYINGNYAGGYARTTGIYGDDYLSADYTASLTCLKILMAMLP